MRCRSGMREAATAGAAERRFGRNGGMPPELSPGIAGMAASDGCYSRPLRESALALVSFDAFVPLVSFGGGTAARVPASRR